MAVNLGKQRRAEYFGKRSASVDDGGARGRSGSPTENYGSAAGISADKRQRGIAFPKCGNVSGGARRKRAGHVRRLGGQLCIDLRVNRARRRNCVHSAELHAGERNCRGFACDREAAVAARKTEMGDGYGGM